MSPRRSRSGKHGNIRHSSLVLTGLMTAMATVTVHGSKQGQYGPLLDQIEAVLPRNLNLGLTQTARQSLAQRDLFRKGGCFGCPLALTLLYHIQWNAIPAGQRHQFEKVYRVDRAASAKGRDSFRLTLLAESRNIVMFALVPRSLRIYLPGAVCYAMTGEAISSPRTRTQPLNTRNREQSLPD